MFRVVLWTFVVCGIVVLAQSVQEIVVIYYSGAEVSPIRILFEVVRAAALAVILGIEVFHELSTGS